MGAVAMFAFLLMTGAVVKDMLDLLAEGHLTIPIFLRLVQLRFLICWYTLCPSDC